MPRVDVRERAQIGRQQLEDARQTNGRSTG